MRYACQEIIFSAINKRKRIQVDNAIALMARIQRALFLATIEKRLSVGLIGASLTAWRDTEIFD